MRNYNFWFLCVFLLKGKKLSLLFISYNSAKDHQLHLLKSTDNVSFQGSAGIVGIQQVLSKCELKK